MKKCTLVQTHPVYYQSETENQTYLKQKITSSSIYNDHKRSQNVNPAKSGGPEKSQNMARIFLCQVDRLEDELMLEQEKHKAITEELEQTFAEMSGY